jgi:hypothetical protein
LYKQFYPMFIRAYSDAADAGPGKKIKGYKSASETDYIQRGEFRLFTAYLCVYCLMADAFSLLDGGRETAESGSVFRADGPPSRSKSIPNANTPATAKPARGSLKSASPSVAKMETNRKISLEEWTLGYAQLAGGPFGCLSRLASSSEDAARAFPEMDADGKGDVLLAEFCTWIKNAEIADDTPIGRLLKVGCVV